MNYKTVKLQCPNCGKEFSSEHSHGGAIEHNNTISNMSVYTGRFNLNDIRLTKDDIFRSLINIGGNYCNIKDHTYKVGMEIYECVLTYLAHSAHSEMHTWFADKEGDVRKEYAKTQRYTVSEYERKLKHEQDKLSELENPTS